MFDLFTLPSRMLLSPIKMAVSLVASPVTLPLNLLLSPVTVPLSILTFPLRAPLAFLSGAFVGVMARFWIDTFVRPALAANNSFSAARGSRSTQIR